MKLTDKEFWEELRKQGGIFARTARAIKAKYKIKYTRQAVRDRALKEPDRYDDILEENIDNAEEQLHTIFLTSRNERNRLQAVQFYLRTIGRKRGYIERQEVEHGFLSEEDRRKIAKDIRGKLKKYGKKDK